MNTSVTTIINAHLIGSGFPHALSKMDLVREHSLAPGTVLVRFVYADMARPPLVSADGPWWMESEHFMKLNHFALAHGLSLGQAAQSLASTRSEWSEVNGFVRAEVMQPLKSWKGRGKSVAGSVKKRGRAKSIPAGAGPEVYQLFIPGIGGTASLFRTTLTYLSFTSVQTAQR